MTSGAVRNSGARRNAPPSFWLETSGDDLLPRPALPGISMQMWRSSARATPDCGLPSICYAPIRRCGWWCSKPRSPGWGASGRNGGWCSALFATSWSRLAREHGEDSARRMRLALQATVADVGRCCEESGIDAHYRHVGTLTLARNPAQLQRLRASYESDRAYLPDVMWLDAAAAADRITVPGTLGATWDPHCASVHPARLVRGLARVVEQLGGRIYERTPVLAVDQGRAATRSGTVRAPVIVRATEGYTAGLPGQRRRLAPIWSLVIATEPMPEHVWAQLKWTGRETVADERHLIIYAQRTADDRIVFGGRGAPYPVRVGHRRLPRTRGDLSAPRRRAAPVAAAAADVRVSHRWGGVLGVPRDWMPSVGLDRESGIAWAGGYVGDGVGCCRAGRPDDRRSRLGAAASSNHGSPGSDTLAGLGTRTPAVAGVRGINAVMASADRVEARTGRPARRAQLAGRLLGH